MATPSSAAAAALKQYPQTLTAMQLLEELSDGDSVWCGPESEPDDVDPISLYSRIPARHSRKHDLMAPASGGGQCNKHEFVQPPGLEVTGTRDEQKALRKSRDLQGLAILPEGAVQALPAALRKETTELKFICVIHLGIQDDNDFCFVKRLLGKGGGNMRQIAQDCNAKVRLRGIGSGFLEGRDAKEANQPLHLCISCTTYEDYTEAIYRASALVKELYRHYRRFLRSQGISPSELPFKMEEVRRDDHGLDKLASKDTRTSGLRAWEKYERYARRKEQHTEQQQDTEPPRSPVRLTEACTARTSSTGGEATQRPSLSRRQRPAWLRRAARAIKAEEEAAIQRSENIVMQPDSQKLEPEIELALPGDFKRRMANEIFVDPSSEHKPVTSQENPQADKSEDDFVPYSTPAGRRTARNFGGAALAAKVAAVARQRSLQRRSAASSTSGFGAPEPCQLSKPKGKGKGPLRKAVYVPKCKGYAT